MASCLYRSDSAVSHHVKCHLTCMEEGHKADSNNTLHSEEPLLFFFKAVFCGQKVGLWLCWVTNYIFFSENLCKVGSFVLTLILFVWHLCPLLTRTFLYKWVVFKGKILTEVWREFKDKKKHGYYTSPCSVWKKSAWLDLCTSTGHFKNSGLCCEACQHVLFTISNR